MSAFFRWPCSSAIHLFPGLSRPFPLAMQHFYSFVSHRSVAGCVRPFPLAMEHVYSFVSQVCHCWCPPFSAGHATFLFICLPGLSLLVSALFRWPCRNSIHLSRRSVTGGVRPFPLAMQHFYSFPKQFTVVRGSQFFFMMRPPFLSLLALFR